MSLTEGERKMKERVYLAIAFAALIVVSMFGGLTTKAAFKGTITVGIIGPVGLPHWEPAGMKPASEMAADEINAAGGIALADGNYQVVLKFGDEHAYPSPDPVAAAAEVERLITVEGCEYIIGGFRSEVTGAMIEMAMAYQTPFIINGAATNEFMSTTVNKTDPVKYEKYKYLFRVNPTNGTTLVQAIAAASQYVIGRRLLPLYGHVLQGMTVPQVKVAVLAEDLLWTNVIYYYLTNKNIYPAVLGPYANVTFQGRIPDGTTDCSTWLQSVKDSGARLLIHVFSGVTGDPLIAQWRSMNVTAIPLGINVMGQLQTHWNTTAGSCDYEMFTNYLGTRTVVIPGVTDVFWDNFVKKTGAWPIYTAAGAYDGMYLLKAGLEGVGSKDKNQLVTYFEDPGFVIPTAAGLGNFKFDNTHDLFSPESSVNWTLGYVRTFVVQWQSARMEIITPVDKIYSKRIAIPTWMYPLKADITYNGVVDILDIFACAKAFGSKPGNARWDKESDVTLDGEVNILDIFAVAKDFGKKVTLPLP